MLSTMDGISVEPDSWNNFSPARGGAGRAAASEALNHGPRDQGITANGRMGERGA